MNFIKYFLQLLNTKIYTNVYTLIIIIVAIYLYHSNLEKVPVKQNEVITFLDSIDKRNKVLFSKIDSLDLNKQEKLTVYHNTTLKYDTIKILVDSMPPIDATLFLLSKSRQLTNQGIE